MRAYISLKDPLMEKNLLRFFQKCFVFLIFKCNVVPTKIWVMESLIRRFVEYTIFLLVLFSNLQNAKL